jgi:S-adenosylmethionine:tRNA ribosyltransferase-isomerase
MTRAAAAIDTPATSTLLADYDFELPAHCIAQQPAERRDASRLLVLDRATGTRDHRGIGDLPALLDPGDLLVVNDTRVIPARVRGRLESGAAVEFLLAHPLAADGDHGACVWRCLGKPGRRLRPQTRVEVFDGAIAEIVTNLGDGQVDVRFPATDLLPLLERHGEIPLPPYIERAGGPTRADSDRYQTIFASAPGAVAAPTAGLHFSDTLLAELRAVGVEIASVTLHVGPGTFLPVRAEDARDHAMLAERYILPQGTVDAIARTRAAGRRVVAVGTTTTRALEAAAAQAMPLRAGAGWADIFLYPGSEFRIVDALVTNFHLPRSTLLLLVSALAGREAILAAYADAIAGGYRFYSYGDAMLIR